ncbi:MAG: FHA domain-containing protein, partial [Anaerolineaceae bacterium]|nr:FHA domain-containing protein [Anaerolineaceae bacterium]
MSPRLNRTLVFLAAFLLLVFAPILPALAQGTARLIISPPTTDSFPLIKVPLEAYDAQGKFLDFLKAEDFQLKENDEIRQIQALQIIEPGIQVIFSINATPVMANRYAGVSRFEKVQTAISAWIKEQPAGTPNTFSLSTNTGLLVTNLTDPGQWASSLKSYQPDLFTTKSGTTSLSQSLDLATDKLPRPDMKRVIIYITTLPLASQVNALKDLTERAATLDVRIFVWFIGSTANTQSDEGKTLQQMADRTGGKLFLLTGPETFPDVRDYLQPLSKRYQISYVSGITTSGSQALEVSLNRKDLQIPSQKISFPLTVSAPNPIFINPPGEITLDWVEKDGLDEPVLVPETIPLNLIVEYPDQHTRPIKFLRLYVNESLVFEQNDPDLDKISWPTTTLNSSGDYLVRVEIEDELGLKSSTINTPFRLNIPVKPRNLFKLILREITWQRILILLTVLGAGTFLALVLIRTGKRSIWGKNKTVSLKEWKDPLTQPVAIKQETVDRHVSAALERPSWPITNGGKLAPARFTRLTESDLKPVTGNSFPINTKDLTIGSDSHVSTLVVDVPGVQGLHARLYLNPEDKYVLADAGTTAGTWVNYAPVSLQGLIL